MEIEGKTVLITGSVRGIGLAIAKAFDLAGAKVILHGRQIPSAEILAQFSKDMPYITGDISNAELIQNEINNLYQQGTQIDILINNAGMTNDKPATMRSEDFAQVINVNLNGTFNVTQPVFKQMRKKKQGVIINLSSIIGLMGNIGQANYAASKAGIIGLTKSLAREGATKGIRVNAIAPGMIESDMTNALSEAQRETILTNIPLKRYGHVDEIAQTVLFLTRNDYITGQTITVDGGLYI
ncbi:3-oxoacyl-ACP reductase FabG [Weissella diestrammenae]|uniref:3-oxoacyl-ACP reductase FabG n=1 Tax=Weissella diestrammenae TaxID=1162633 RepID=A0A7G9T622_9LACO|nr:3-oxoacyl-ACP reductase family protein [Weissella diestrammenae]MCM0582382.1 3-oxoacyl-ACP reductase FabG [Weissella diestrammenae]QNN75547.1 3-oxoacyl-ACP reductase FabG [Weissella diestrammenae]